MRTAWIVLTVSLLLAGCGPAQIVTVPVEVPVTVPVTVLRVVTPTAAVRQPTPTQAPATVTLTTRDGLELALSNFVIGYPAAAPDESQKALLLKGVYIPFDLIQTVEFSELATIHVAEVPTITVTLLDGSVLMQDAAYTNFCIFDCFINPRMKGTSNLGDYEASLSAARKISFQHPAASSALPPPTPTSASPVANAFTAVVTDKLGVSTTVTNLVLHEYLRDTSWSPPKVTNEFYRFWPTNSGLNIDFGQIEKVECADSLIAEGPNITITLRDGTTITDQAPLVLWRSDVEGNAPLGRFDISFDCVKTIVYR